jgi:uncharacterized RDD family membrane protein YckC
MHCHPCTTGAIPPMAVDAPEARPSGNGLLRFTAYLMDKALSGALALVPICTVLLPDPLVDPVENVAGTLTHLATIAAVALLFWGVADLMLHLFFERSSLRTTPAKLFLGLDVVHASGRTLSVRECVLRNLGRNVPTALLWAGLALTASSGHPAALVAMGGLAFVAYLFACLSVVVSEHGQAWYDRLSHAVVRESVQVPTWRKVVAVGSLLLVVFVDGLLPESGRERVSRSSLQMEEGRFSRF